jgi:prepilin-type N-terminal cleavage/methylation domain-containing protein
MKTMRGFTLLELLIVLAIIGVLAAWGVPNFNQTVKTNRLVTNANNLLYAFQLARSEAITRSKPIDIVAATGGWAAGWSVKDGTATLMSWEAVSGDITITATGSTTSFQFSAQGRLNTTDTLKVCDGRTAESGRNIAMTAIGRVSVTPVTCD